LADLTDLTDVIGGALTGLAVGWFVVGGTKWSFGEARDLKI
jgi:hypothetical protein